VSKRTKAILPVHLYGQAADMHAICAFAKRHDLVVIEDCAQATGGVSDGKRLGSFGDAACFSFFPTKNLGAIGDGGMVVTNNREAAERIRRLRQYGWDARRDTQDIGINSRLDEIQAAILAAKLPGLDANNARRAQLAARYSKGLAGLPPRLPETRPDSDHVYHLYVLLCDDRDALKSSLAAAGIGAGIHYPLPVHRQGGYAQRVRMAVELPVTNRLVECILSLPIYPELRDDEADRVIQAIHAHYRR
jgi:dTDP-4-amino-4,6-dideoxygalactose transaminase